MLTFFRQRQANLRYRLKLVSAFVLLQLFVQSGCYNGNDLAKSGQDAFVSNAEDKGTSTENVPLAPRRIHMKCLVHTPEPALREMVVTDEAKISRVWKFVNSHYTRTSDLVAPAPYNLGLTCELNNDQILEMEYQQDEWGFRANGRHGRLTNDERLTLTDIAKELLGVRY